MRNLAVGRDLHSRPTAHRHMLGRPTIIFRSRGFAALRPPLSGGTFCLFPLRCWVRGVRSASRTISALTDAASARGKAGRVWVLGGSHRAAGGRELVVEDGGAQVEQAEAEDVDERGSAIDTVSEIGG